MVSLKHTFNSPKADGVDVTLVKPSDWNAEHTLTTAAGGVVLGRPVGTPGAVQEITIASITSGLLAPGMVMHFAGIAAPSGWLLCNGQLVSKTTYAALYAALSNGTLYGQSGTNFNVPDLKGRVVAGLDGGANRLPAYNTPGNAGGLWYSSTGTFTSSATIAFNFGNIGLVGGATVANSASSTSTVQGGGGVTVANPGGTEQVTGYTPVTATHGVSVSGASGNFNIMQPTLVMNYIIKT